MTGTSSRAGFIIRAFVLWCLIGLSPLAAAPYAAMVVDARSGEVLHSRNADTRLHPASLTKMMTLYVVFDAIEKGEISLDTQVTISRFAAAEPPSKLGLKPGQKIALRYLIRAAAVKSANDAATALGEAISGSEAAFARRMNRMAQALGMDRSTFRNAHGLTEEGHLSTARDMTTLGRHLFYDYPQYYNIFSRHSTDAGIKAVNNTNRKLLNGYRGADGIKTGYTRAAGYNLVASAERGSERIIATVFGGRSGAWRNERVAELLDMGFARAPTRVAVVKPRKPVLGTTPEVVVATAVMTAVPRPPVRPMPAATVPSPSLVALQNGIADALAEAVVAEVEVPDNTLQPDEPLASASLAGLTAERPAEVARLSSGALLASLRPEARPEVEEGSSDPEGDIVVRLEEGAPQWSIKIGRFGSRHDAEKALLQTALVEMNTLDDALRRIVQTSRGFDATFTGLSAERAQLACRRLVAQGMDCSTEAPGV